MTPKPSPCTNLREDKRVWTIDGYISNLIKIGAIVIKLKPDVDPIYELNHWVTSSISGPMVEPQCQTK